MSEQAPRSSFTNDRTRALEAELAEARAALAATVDELTDRLNPRRQAARAVAGARRAVSNLTDPGAGRDERKHAIITVAVVAAVVGFVVAGVVRAVSRPGAAAAGR